MYAEKHVRTYINKSTRLEQPAWNETYDFVWVVRFRSKIAILLVSCWRKFDKIPILRDFSFFQLRIIGCSTHGKKIVLTQITIIYSKSGVDNFGMFQQFMICALSTFSRLRLRVRNVMCAPSFDPLFTQFNSVLPSISQSLIWPRKFKTCEKQQHVKSQMLSVSAPQSYIHMLVRTYVRCTPQTYVVACL